MDHLRFIYLSVSIIFLALAAPSAGAAPLPIEPAQVVSAFHDSLLGVMKEAKTLGGKGRFERLAPTIKESFHLPLMIQVASSSYWKKADTTQVEKLVEAFTRLSVSTYASQFNGYSGQAFKTTGTEAGPQKTTLIRTQIINPGSDPVDLTYVTRKIKGSWRIIDVLLAGGISELAVRRSEYRRILKSKGIDGLIAALNAKADQLLAE